MIRREKCLVVDIDGTLCPTKQSGQKYQDLEPFVEMLDRLRQYREQGFYIILLTSRNMQTYDGNIGLILANTAPVLSEWLQRHNVCYDELHFGKPWPGEGGFYIDDRAIRPSEFLTLSYEEVQAKLAAEQKHPAVA